MRSSGSGSSNMAYPFAIFSGARSDPPGDLPRRAPWLATLPPQDP
jgi:hypothetical protein